MNIIQIGCNDGNDSVFSFVSDHEKDIENCLLIDANPEALKKATDKYSKFPFCEFRNLAVLPIETEGYEIKLFCPRTDRCSGYASVNKHHVLATLRKEIENHAHIKLPFTVDLASELLEYKVSTISLTSLFKEYIKTDHLFIDTEGLDALNLLSVNFNKTNLKQIVFEHIHADGLCQAGPRLKCLIEYLKEFGFAVTPDPHCELNQIAKR